MRKSRLSRIGKYRLAKVPADTGHQTEARRLALHSCSGFTLIEVLVALAILSVSFITLFASFSQSLVSSRELERRMAARVLAQNLIAELGLSIPLKLGDTSGVSTDGLVWSVKIKRIADTAYDNGPLVPLTTVVRVGWSRGTAKPFLSLTTIKLLTKDRLK